MRLYLRYSIAPLLVLIASACGGSDAGANPGPESDAESASGMVMPSMQPGGMMEQTEQHLQMMAGLSGDSMTAVLPQHRQVVADMLGQMNREMIDMSMPMDGAWNAIADSLRQDLTRMGDMSAPDLQAFMPEHGGRVMRLMETHRGMMGGMRM